MKLQHVVEFLKDLPNAKPSGTDYLLIRCPFCGDSIKHMDSTHFSIKINVSNGEPMWYQCFRAECEEKGILNTDTLQLLGCTDMTTLTELSIYNKGLNKSFDKEFNNKVTREYQLVNRNYKLNRIKLDYFNHRLGTSFDIFQLRDFRIQLSLYDLLSINDIHKLSYGKQTCDNIDAYTIGFVSMYKDYLICRDITKDLVTGKRYTIYRISGKENPLDMKLYSIPTELDLLTPKSANINVAEGPFSILGAYLHTDIGKNKPNNIWLANCGSKYLSTILHTCKQYGLLRVHINIFSDSEIKLYKYEKLYGTLKDRLDIRSFNIFYNKISDDFGHAKKDIQVNAIRLYEKE